MIPEPMGSSRSGAVAGGAPELGAPARDGPVDPRRAHCRSVPVEPPPYDIGIADEIAERPREHLRKPADISRREIMRIAKADVAVRRNVAERNRRGA